MNHSLHILLVEDSPMDQKIIQRALNRNWKDVVIKTACDYQSASILLRQEVFHCILLDYRLPDSNGLDALKAIKCMGIETPIIIVTSQADTQVAASTIIEGAYDYISKDEITPATLKQSIQRVLKIYDEQMLRIRAEQSLAKSERKYRELVEFSKAIICKHKLDGTIISANKQFERFRGTSKKYIIGKNFTDFIPTERQAGYDACMQNAIKEGHSSGIIVLENTIKDTSSFFFNLVLKEEGEEETPYVMSFGQDISNRVRAEEAYKKAKEIAEQSAKVKQDFLANMSHEIRTPMNAILGFARLLLQRELDDEGSKYAHNIYHAAENLLVIINDILDFSKLESGKFSIETIPFSLKELVDTLESMFARQAKDKGIGLRVEIAPMVPPSLIGDPIRLNQILINLISNAIKFTKKGEVSVSITAEHKEEALLIRLKVSDSGIGIATDKLDMIFESFSQADSHTTRQFGGTGLGLAIVKRLCELMGGDITISSEIGIGSTFTVQIPMQAGESVMTVQQQSNQSAALGVSLDGLRILLAEDNLMNQQLAHILLTKIGCIVEIVNTGKAAVEMLEKQPFDIILMDIQMPEMDGIEATRVIRKSEKPFKNIPIVAMTAHALEGERERYEEVGMQAYISKPFSQEQLYKTLLLFYDNQIDQASIVEPKIPTWSTEDLDLSYLKTVAGDATTMGILIGMFKQGFSEFVQDAQSSIEATDYQLGYLATHKIKSNLKAVGSKKLSSNTEDLETIFYENKSMEHATKLLEDIEQQFHSIIDYIEVTPFEELSILG